MAVLEEEFSKSIGITKTIFSITGMPIYNKGVQISTCRNIINKFLYFMAFLMLTLNVIMLITSTVLKENLQFTDLTNILPCAVFCMLGLVKLWTIQSKLKKADEILAHLHRLWPTGEDNQEVVKTIRQFMKNARLTSMVITVLNNMFVWLWNVTPISMLIYYYVTTNEVIKTLPYLFYIPFDTTGTFTYPLAYAYHVVAGWMAVIGVIGPDNYFVAISTHICLQFKLLQIKLKGIIEEVLPHESQNELDMDHGHHEKMYNKLVESIKVHMELIKLAEDVEEIFSFSLLINIIASSIEICCAGFQATVVTGIDIPIFMLFLSVSIVNIFALCAAGYLLIDTSTGVADAAYNSTWYVTDKKFRQLILFIMQRAQKPQIFTTFKFSVVSMESFSAILRTSYSYFALIQTTYKK